ncbi:hypothetical protein EB077_08310 [bacterium]|nr:hypothetical protein [bacterium]
MTEEDKLKVVNLLMLLQVVVYAVDETESIPWFNHHRTKAISKNFLNIVLTEHGEVIKAFWDIPELNINEIIEKLDNFGREVGSLSYYDLTDVTVLIKEYKQQKKT